MQTAQYKLQSTLHQSIRSHLGISHSEIEEIIRVPKLESFQMYHFKEHATILFWTILVIDGERWYSASLVDSVLDLPKLVYLGAPPVVFKTSPVISAHKHQQSNIVNSSNHTKWSDWNFMRKQDVTTTASLPTQTVNKNSKHKIFSKLLNKKNTPKYEPVPVISAFNIDAAEPHNAVNNNRNLPPVFKFNNTIRNINVIRTSKPKKQVIQKRCPSLRPRQKKQIDTNDTAKKRFLEVFEVVEFDHVACTSSSGLEGTCLPENECQDSGGSTMGSCADGYGTCCVSE